MKKKFIISFAFIFLVVGFASNALASHTWGGYHWARTSNPFTVKLGNNLSGSWTSFLTSTTNDWSASSVLDTVIVKGSTTSRTCKPTLGRVEVCNSKYGNNGWLGIAQIWTSYEHIVQATTKLNDTYFSKPQYNTTAWKNLVMCQEVGHVFGLDHQDEIFDNANLGTCMDYTNNPLTNQHPNAHDYEELEAIYAHLDSTTTVGAVATNVRGNEIGDNASDWGRALRNDKNGKANLYRKDLGNGMAVYTHVFWAEGDHDHDHE